MIGELNIVITFCLYDLLNSDNGTPIKSEQISCYTEFCKVENLSGSRALEEQQINFTEAFRVTKRFFDSRPVDKTKTLLDYNGKTLTIHSVRYISEGRKSYESLLCYADSNTI